MNTVMTPLGRIDHHHPPSPHEALSATRHTPRVALIDRIALRVGIALVAWSRRPRAFDDRTERARRAQTALSTEQRERATQRRALLLLPPR